MGLEKKSTFLPNCWGHATVIACISSKNKRPAIKWRKHFVFVMACYSTVPGRVRWASLQEFKSISSKKKKGSIFRCDKSLCVDPFIPTPITTLVSISIPPLPWCPGWLCWSGAAGSLGVLPLFIHEVDLEVAGDGPAGLGRVCVAMPGEGCSRQARSSLQSLPGLGGPSVKGRHNPLVLWGFCFFPR